MPGERYAMVDGTLYDDLASTIAAIESSTADTTEVVLYSGVTAADLGNTLTSGTIAYAIRYNASKPVCLVADKDADIMLYDCSQMFYKAGKLKSADLRGFNTSNVTSMANMFSLSEVKILDLSSFSIESVTNMNNMFSNCYGLTTIYTASDADWSKTTASSENMFSSCTELVGGNGTTYNSEHMDATYARVDGVGQPGYFTKVRYAMVDGVLCDDLTSTIAAIESSTADTIKVVVYSGVSAADLGKATTSGSIIASLPNCKGSTKSTIFTVDKDANILLGADCSKMFQGKALVSADLSGFNTSNVTNMLAMFSNCSRLATLNLSSFNTSYVSNMEGMFCDCSALTTIDVNGFNTENVTNMSNMFSGCLRIITLDLSGFNTAKVNDMSGMFTNCWVLTPLDVSRFNTENVTKMDDMFLYCKALTTIDVSGFNTEKVTTMEDMFYGCEKLTTLDLSSFNTEKVTTVQCMFYNCSKLSTIYAANGANWNKESGLTSVHMFTGCTSLKGGNGTAFSSSATDATYALVDGLNGQPGYFTSTGVLGGRFSVSAGKQVYFSQGNLQYQASTGTWRFAENQYDYVGSTNANISSTYTGWIDLFGWGASGYNDMSPYMTSTTDTDYGNGENDIAGTEYDWGVHNAISNGGNQAGLWRTLTQEEWAYMLEDESRSGKYGFGKVGIVDDSLVNGLILLPDDWTHPTDISSSSSQTFTSGKSTSSTSWPNTYTADDWAKMQAAGAVFLPAAGYRKNNTISVNQSGNMGDYWLATANGADKAYRLYFTPTDIDGASASNRNYGFSVRLVRDK